MGAAIACYKFTTRNGKALDKPQRRSKIPENSGKTCPSADLGKSSGFMNPKPPSSPQSVNMKQACKHPRVQIVSRDEDSEFVECKECGEIFESSEFKDMNIEDRIQDQDI
jgi:hypothetical protein